MKRLVSIPVFVFFAGCGGEGPVSPTVTVTNVVEAVRTVVVTNAVTVTNVVTVRRDPATELTSRRTAPYLVESSVLTHRQLQAALAESSARVLALGRVAVIEANARILGKIGEDGTLCVRPLGAGAKIVCGAETGGMVLVRPVSRMDFDAVAARVKAIGGEFLGPMPADDRTALLCRLSTKKIMEIAARPDVWSIERYGRK